MKQNWCPSSFEMSNIRVKIELLLAAYYAVFPVCFESQGNVLNYNMWQCSRESSHLIFVWVHCSMQCEELLFHKQIPSLQIKKNKDCRFWAWQRNIERCFSSCCERGKRKSSEIPCCCVFVKLSLVIDHIGITLCLIIHNLCLGVTDLWSWLKLLKIFCISSFLKSQE